MSRRKVKRCQRRYYGNTMSGKSEVCGTLLPRMSDSIYCPSCAAKLASIKHWEELDKALKEKFDIL
jgi:hypothetical protein